MIRAEFVDHADVTVSMVSDFPSEAKPALPVVLTERVNETRYTYTFTAAEIVEILKAELLKGTSQPRYMHDAAEVAISAPVPEITLKVTVQERY